MKILIVEDDALSALMLIEALERAGHKVIGPAYSVPLAVALAGRTLPDLALVDLDLGRGGNGADLLPELEEVGHVPAIIISGDRPDDRTRAAALGYIGKPYRIETVLATVDVVQDIDAGRLPDGLPPELELFRTAH